jgi:hypothetical protein
MFGSHVKSSADSRTAAASAPYETHWFTFGLVRTVSVILALTFQVSALADFCDVVD